MIRLVNAEWLKLRTTQVWIWLLLVAAAVAAVAVIGPLATNGYIARQDVADMFGGSEFAFVVVFVLGILGITTEFRYKTITSAVLTTPSRWAIVSAKLIAYAVVGAGYSLVCIAVQLAIALPWFAAKGIASPLSAPDVTSTLVNVFLTVMIFGLIGIGVGALIRNQIVAVVIGFVWLFVVDNLVQTIPGVRYAFPYTPNGAASAMLGDGNADFGVRLLPYGAALVVLLLWALIPAAVGAAVSMNRDIT